MNLLTILLGLLAMLGLYFTIHLAVNRGKVKISYLVTALLYSFAVGIPVAYYSQSPDKLRPVLYGAYYAVLLGPFFGLEVFNSLKKRQTWTRFLLIFSGIVLILSSPFVRFPESTVLIGAGLVCITGFFVYLFRYPHMNAMWLADAVLRAAEKVEKNCRYSPKPIVLPVPSRITSCGGTGGLFLMFKRNAAIVRVTRKLHGRLGKPNMEQFAEELVRIVKNAPGIHKNHSKTGEAR